MLPTVQFIFRSIQEASLVEIAGSFNNWTKIGMIKSDGEWRISLNMEPGIHQYKYIVDGKWEHDEGKQTTNDNMGGLNNVINVVEVFEKETVGKDDKLGMIKLSIPQLVAAKSIINQWVKLEQSKCGAILISWEYIPSEEASKVAKDPEPVGSINLCVLKARALMVGEANPKANPYIKVTLGNQIAKSATIDNNPNPEWNFDVSLDILKDSPEEVMIEIFDEDIIGKSDKMGFIREKCVEEQTPTSDIGYFIKFVAASGGSVPHNAFPGGKDGSWETMYIARAMHGRSKVPGKLIPSQGVVYISWGGQEHAKTDYEVLVQEGNLGNLIWFNGSIGKASGAIEGGHEADGSPLYVGRAMVDNQWCVGKVSPKYNKCYIPHKGKELEIDDEYQVLCINNDVDFIVIAATGEPWRHLSYLSSNESGEVYLTERQDDHSGRQKWIFKHLVDDVYNILVSGGNEGEKFLSCRADGFVELWSHGGGDRQKWRIQPDEEDTYNIKVLGRTNSGKEFLSCTEEGLVDLYSHAGERQGRTRQRWKLILGACIVSADEGEAAEYCGHSMGLYRLNNDQSYTQVGGSNYIYPMGVKRTEYHWYIGYDFMTRSGYMKNLKGSSSVPAKGWKYWPSSSSHTAGEWVYDGRLSVRMCGLQELKCNTISITSSRCTQQLALGDFTRIQDDILNGHLVFRNTNNQYLRVPTGSPVWNVGPQRDDLDEWLSSGRATSCPAHRYSGLSRRRNRKHWTYFNEKNEWEEDPSLVVTCDVHSYKTDPV